MPSDGFYWQRRDRRQHQVLWWRRRIRSRSRHHSELHDLAGGGRFRDVEINSRDAAAEWLVRPDVTKNVAAERDVREVDNDVRTLGRRQQQTVSGGRDVDQSGQQAPSSPSARPRLPDRTEIEDQERELHPFKNLKR